MARKENVRFGILSLDFGHSLKDQTRKKANRGNVVWGELQSGPLVRSQTLFGNVSREPSAY